MIVFAWFTLGVSGGAIGSAINVGQKVSSATKSQDGRASALWGIAAGRDAFDAAAGAGDAMKALEAGKGPQGTAITLPQVFVPNFDSLERVGTLPFVNKIPGVKP